MRYPLAKETPRGGDRGGDGAGGGGGAGGGAGAGEGGGAGSGGDDDGFESGDEAPLQTRKQLKQRAQKAAETQRKARASKLRTDVSLGVGCHIHTPPLAPQLPFFGGLPSHCCTCSIFSHTRRLCPRGLAMTTKTATRGSATQCHDWRIRTSLRHHLHS